MAKKKKKQNDPDKKMIVRNRRAKHDYQIEEELEAGIALVGSEVKSLRLGNVQVSDAFAGFKGDELFLQNLHIAEYEQANQQNHDPTRPRKLLLHRRELERLQGKLKQTGLTLVPLEIYFRKRHIKVLLGLGKGKKNYDKRDKIEAKDARRVEGF